MQVGMVTPVVVDALRKVSLERVVGAPSLVLLQLLGLGRLGQSSGRHGGHVGPRDVNPGHLLHRRARQVRLVLWQRNGGLIVSVG